jgi:hypothetical protein
VRFSLSLCLSLLPKSFPFLVFDAPDVALVVLIPAAKVDGPFLLLLLRGLSLFCYDARSVEHDRLGSTGLFLKRYQTEEEKKEENNKKQD